ncbi:hypothetical protein SAMN05421778_1408 [Sphaerotilus natans]|uniref:hypothetical protein n=1 Tax=Sphaerotilus natans TaxID=34103 RepID=UPI0009556684|nr:hypothetical protein [Sphaerotilus natans]SIS08575.1 hypothetical protein SAMN05421778_1408 [Sphaerotilus natans]
MTVPTVTTQDPAVRLRSLRIPVLLRCMPLQVLTILLFGVGAVIGALSEEGRVLKDFGVYVVKDLPEVVVFYAVLFAGLMGVTGLVQPLRVRFRVIRRPDRWCLAVAWGYVLTALALMAYNWFRLDVINLLQDNPGAIAFRFAEEGGAVLLYTTMLCIFIGAAYLLDHLKGAWARRLVIGALVLFAVGLLGMTRREMLLLLILWLVVHLSTAGLRWVKYALWGVFALTVGALYFSMLVRGIDMLEDPLSYFSSGEFEPFRYALLLGGEWLRNPVALSPWPYSFPMAGDQGLVSSVNGYFSGLMFGDVNALGYPTVTMFSTFLYFGFVGPLVFYAISVFFVKQVAYWLSISRGFYTSFLYAFVLLRLILFIRNGELFATLLDTLVLAFQALLFHALVCQDVLMSRDSVRSS